MKYLILLLTFTLFSCEGPDETTQKLQEKLRSQVLKNECEKIVKLMKPQSPDDIYLSISKNFKTKELYCDIIYKKSIGWVSANPRTVSEILNAFHMKDRIQRDKEGYENITIPTTNN